MKKKASKRFSNLSEAERARVEADYHRRQPGDFDGLMARAERHIPETTQLPAATALPPNSNLTEKL
jgi:hypothetical protein